MPLPVVPPAKAWSFSLSDGARKSPQKILQETSIVLLFLPASVIRGPRGSAANSGGRLLIDRLQGTRYIRLGERSPCLPDSRSHAREGITLMSNRQRLSVAMLIGMLSVPNTHAQTYTSDGAVRPNPALSPGETHPGSVLAPSAVDPERDPPRSGALTECRTT